MMLMQSLLPLTLLPTEALVATCRQPSESDCSTQTANNKDITARRHRLAATHLTETATTATTTTTATTVSTNPVKTDKSCTGRRPGRKLTVQASGILQLRSTKW